MKLKLDLPRKYSRLPRLGVTRNPFKAGTSSTSKRVKGALGAHTAALAINNIPGKAVAAGALGARLAGPGGAAAAFGATEAASVATSALLARSIARRGKAASYLARRAKRKTGVYKAMVEELYQAIEKAGLIKPGKPPLMKRVAFLLSTNRNERNYRIGRYLESRKAGKGFGPKGKRRARTGAYTGVYATGINKAELSAVDAIDTLNAEIEKARRGGPRSGMIPYGSNHQYQRARFFEARANRRGETQSPRAVRARAYLAQRYRGGAGPGGRARTAFYKSTEPAMTDAVDDLYDAIEKARTVYRGQTMTTRQRRHWAKNGNVFTGAAPAGRVSAKDSGAVKRKLKRLSLGTNAAAAKRAVRARGDRFQRMFGKR